MENLKPNFKVKYKDRNIQKSKSLHIYVESYLMLMCMFTGTMKLPLWFAEKF